MTAKKQDFLRGAFILSLSGLIVKAVGVFFRIPLTNLVGSAAMSYYSSAYSVYILLLAISTSGLPTGIAVLVSGYNALGNYRSVRRTVGTAFFFFTSIGFILSFTGVLFAGPIAVLMNSEEAYFSVAAIMPSVFFVSAVSVFRGYFQGLGNMVPTAVSNIIEAVSKLVFGYGFAFFLHKGGYPDETVVGGAVCGVTVGTVLSCLYMLIAYSLKKNKKTVSGFFGKADSGGKIFSSLMSVSLPVTLSAVTSSLMGTIDSFLVMSRMKEYMNTETAKLFWGAYANMSQTVFNLPSFIMVSLSTSLVPAVSSAFTLKKTGELRKTVSKAFRFTSVFAFGSAFFLFFAADDILSILFGGDPGGVSVAVPLLKTLSFALISVGFTNVTAAALNSVGKSHLSVFSVAVGAAVKIFLTYILVGIPEVNVSGAPLSTDFAYPVMLILNLVFLRKSIGRQTSFFGNVFLPALSSASALFVVIAFFYCFSLRLPHFLSFLISFFLFFIVYISLLFAFGCIDFCGYLRNFTKMKKSP